MPQMSDPTLMIDFLTAAYDVGEWSVLNVVSSAIINNYIIT